MDAKVQLYHHSATDSYIVSLGVDCILSSSNSTMTSSVDVYEFSLVVEWSSYGIQLMTRENLACETVRAST